METVRKEKKNSNNFMLNMSVAPKKLVEHKKND